MSITWFKLDHNIIGDIKLRRFSSQEKWAWITLLCLSSQSDDRGLITADIDDIADLCDYDSQDFKYLLDKFKTKGMIDYSNGGIKIINWEKRQHSKPSDSPESTRERKRKQRARQKEKISEVSRDVTPTSRDVTLQIRLDKDLDQDTDQDQIKKREDPEARAREETFSREPDLVLENPISKILENPIVEESIEGELLSSEIELHQSVPVQNSKSRSDRSGASAARNPARGALEQAFGCKSSSDPNFARFRRAYQGVLAIGDGNSSFGNMRDAQIAWQGLVDEGAIDDLFWRGVDAYLVQQGQLRMRGEKNFPPGAAKFLETRAWETALLRSEQQAAAKGAGLPDVGTTAAERAKAEFKANMAEAKKIIQARYAC
ncbi:MAG: phage replisome organizer N-terminal domain-containing protein [Microcoleus sp.]